MERLWNFNDLNHRELSKQFLVFLVRSGSTIDLAVGSTRQKAATKRLRKRQGPAGRSRRSTAFFREQTSPAPQLSGRGRRRQSTKPESSIPAPPPSQPGQVTLRPLLLVPPPPSIGRPVSLLAGACRCHWPAGLPVAAPRPAPPRPECARRPARFVRGGGGRPVSATAGLAGRRLRGGRGGASGRRPRPSMGPQRPGGGAGREAARAL